MLRYCNLLASYVSRSQTFAAAVVMLALQAAVSVAVANEDTPSPAAASTACYSHTDKTDNQRPQYIHPKPEGVSMGCQALTSKRYISDGSCTSIRPITERVCGGLCLPVEMVPWYAECVKYWSRNKVEEYRCVDERTRRRTVTLQCDNGDIRRYEIRVVTACKCKRYNRIHNQSPSDVDWNRRSAYGVDNVSADETGSMGRRQNAVVSGAKQDRMEGSGRRRRRRPPLRTPVNAGNRTVGAQESADGTGAMAEGAYQGQSSTT